jgi:hypothetical protein
MTMTQIKPIEFIGRPKRTFPIDNDDIVNLLIALNTARTLEEFLLLV